MQPGTSGTTGHNQAQPEQPGSRASTWQNCSILYSSGGNNNETANHVLQNPSYPESYPKSNSFVRQTFFIQLAAASGSDAATRFDVYVQDMSGTCQRCVGDVNGVSKFLLRLTSLALWPSPAERSISVPAQRTPPQTHRGFCRPPVLWPPAQLHHHLHSPQVVLA